jgi:hypothetical protein
MFWSRWSQAERRKSLGPEAKISFRLAQKYVEKLNSSAFAGEADGQNQEIVFDCILSCCPVREATELGKALYRVLRIVVVPGNPIIREERKQMISVLCNSSNIILSDL